jgi:hypothetical protein
MSLKRLFAKSLAIFATFLPWMARAEPSDDPRYEKRLEAAEVLRAALGGPRAEKTPLPAVIGRYTAACSRAVEILGPDSQAANALAGAIELAATEKSNLEQTERTMRSVIRETCEALAFKPLLEASLPEGFPHPTPLGEIEIKRYPAYRMAQADTSGSSAFWALFGHIKREGIAMTAPVQMDYAAQAGAAAEQQSMAFLYGNPELGEPADDGSVRVVDVLPMTVVSVGVRGVTAADSVAAARDKLEQWLEANRDRYLADGPIRVMGYNSPFVPAERRYFEVQIPIKEPANAGN